MQRDGVAAACWAVEAAVRGGQGGVGVAGGAPRGEIGGLQLQALAAVVCAAAVTGLCWGG